jgi:dipeptide/tripeptide permease
VLLGFGLGSIIFTYTAGIFRDSGNFGTAFIIASLCSFAGVLIFLKLKSPTSTEAMTDIVNRTDTTIAIDA